MLACQMRTTIDSNASVTCQGAADAAQRAAERSGDPRTPLASFCTRCCPTQGLENTDPLGCACGRIGLSQRLFGIER